jgi:micrococcal nuclease
MSKRKRYKGWRLYVYWAFLLFFGFAYLTAGAEEVLDNVDKEVRSGSLFEVTHVVDGDTFDILKDGEEIRVRLLGVDTPETVHPSKPVECFGKEASDFTRLELLGDWVEIEFDKTQGEYDRYGRILVYVYEDGEEISFNERLLREGYANRYISNVPILYADEFDEALDWARENGIGLWGRTCS